MRLTEIVAWGLCPVCFFAGMNYRHLSRGSDAVCSSVQWNGGSPNSLHSGSCWCGQADGYCMCTPSLAIDLVIEVDVPPGVSSQSTVAVALVHRKDSGRMATMGGFVDVDEDVEAAVARELKEETGLELQGRPELLGVYSDPRRDHRRHTVSAVFVSRGVGTMRAGDDAKQIEAVPLEKLGGLDYAFDHAQIIRDYLELRHGMDSAPLKGEPLWARSRCPHP
mmetsp:Transcript_15803/g.49993  ORF Transcript_15803/g.49993 Transcript_15803/m.49993 type:complete len:222 (+) Transcript_15803:84-749(+)